MARTLSPLLLLLTIIMAVASKKFWAGHPAQTYREFTELGEKLKSGQYELTYFELRNFASQDITDTKVSVENEADWGDKRYYPESNLQHWQVQSRYSLICPEVVNQAVNSSHFTMTLLYADKSIEKFTINQQAVLDKSLDFKHITGDRNITTRIAGRQLEVIVFENQEDILDGEPKFIYN